MNLEIHLKRGWEMTMKFIGPVLLLTVVYFVVSICSLMILAPVVSAGYVQSLLRAMRDGRSPEVKDLFSEMSLFLPLFCFGLLLVVVISLGFLLLILPGIALSLLSVFACLYLIPLMTDRGLGLFDALKGSWKMATKEPIGDHIIIVVVYSGLLAIGNSLPFAILFAQPLATFIFLSVYEERVRGLSGLLLGDDAE